MRFDVRRPIVGFVSAILLAPAAHAEYRLHNMTGDVMRVAVDCGTGAPSVRTMAPGAATAMFCHSQAPASIRLITVRGGATETVRATLRDGATYLIGYDGQGDANVRRVGQEFAGTPDAPVALAAR